MPRSSTFRVASVCLLAQGLVAPALAQPSVALPIPISAPPVAAPLGPPADQPMPRFVNKGPGAPKGRSDSSDAFSRLRAVSHDPAYGYTKGQPVKVGGARENTDARASLYLNALRGPAGQPMAYVRLGTCCYFTPLTAATGSIGLLNVYSLSYEGLAKPFLLYIDIYDTEPGLVPVGLTARP